MLKERNQRRRHRNDLRRCHVHVLNTIRRGQRKFIFAATRHQLIGELVFLVEFGVGLRDNVFAFFNRRQVVDLVCHMRVFDHPIRRLEETVFIGARKQRQRVNQADVRTFRRFDRAYPAVVRRMHVADFEAGPFARQTTWSERRDPTLVRDFRKRVGLIHKLRQLRRAEEFTNRRRYRFRVDEVVRHQVF